MVSGPIGMKTYKKKSEGLYKNGKLDGLWTVWSEAGERMDEAYFVDGKEY